MEREAQSPWHHFCKKRTRAGVVPWQSIVGVAYPPMASDSHRDRAFIERAGTPITFSTRKAMRKTGALVLAGFAFFALLAASATVASAELSKNGEASGVAVERATPPRSPSVHLSHPPLRFAGSPDRATGVREDPEAKASLTALARHALAGAKWMFTRHIGLFFDYKCKSTDPSPNILDAPFDTKLNITHVFGGVAIHF